MEGLTSFVMQPKHGKQSKLLHKDVHYHNPNQQKKVLQCPPGSHTSICTSVKRPHSALQADKCFSKRVPFRYRLLPWLSIAPQSASIDPIRGAVSHSHQNVAVTPPQASLALNAVAVVEVVMQVVREIATTSAFVGAQLGLV